jgi:hypothetical protein
VVGGFNVGDRVMARTSTFVPTGTPGHVQQVLLSVSGLYFVQFVGFSRPWLMRTHELERSDDMRLPDHERTA